jgi:hypothetical protein
LDHEDSDKTGHQPLEFEDFKHLIEMRGGYLQMGSTEKLGSRNRLGRSKKSEVVISFLGFVVFPTPKSSTKTGETVFIFQYKTLNLKPKHHCTPLLIPWRCCIAVIMTIIRSWASHELQRVSAAGGEMVHLIYVLNM